ncbi:MAG: glycosyltransferase, partial [Ruminococcaceae bacterium]|nr:glycosyltransferase [Oscillospiraceae bacterium]
YSFPSKTMEYMASGKPVVMYRLDGIPSEYDPYLFYADPEADPVDGMREILSWVLSHKEEASERAALARKFVTTQKNAHIQGQRILSFMGIVDNPAKKVLFMTNIPSPYRVDFFNLFGRHCDLTVAFEREVATNRDARWERQETKNFKKIYANVKPWKDELSRGKGLVELIRKNLYDIVIFSGYGSPAARRAIAYCRRKKIPYYIEYDGAFNKKDLVHKYLAKKYLVKEAKGHFITCRELEEYLARLGVSRKRLLKYPFSSLNASDILTTPCSAEERAALKTELGIKDSCVALSVGQFIPRKGFDVLMKAMAAMKNTCDFYIVGGTPPPKYLQMKEKLGLDRLHFLDFMSKEELKRWYRACDIFVLPTREDIWGLVINEAMANGAPVVATNRCIAALELIEEGTNGYVVPIEDERALAEKLDVLVENPELRAHMAEANLKKIRAYTIESMAEAHIAHLKRIEQL